MKPDRCGPRTHDDVRQDTTSLLAALNMAEGPGIGGCLARHRHEEFLKFLRQNDRQTPPELALHLIADNSGTHQPARVRQWLRAHPRFHLPFTPTDCSWLNLVERWFGEITRQRIRRGRFPRGADLVAPIQDSIRCHNENPRPLVWTKRAEEILEKVRHSEAEEVTPH